MEPSHGPEIPPRLLHEVQAIAGRLSDVLEDRYTIALLYGECPKFR